MAQTTREDREQTAGPALPGRSSSLLLLAVCLTAGCRVAGVWEPLAAPGVRLIPEPKKLTSAETRRDGVRVRVSGTWILSSSFLVEVHNSRSSAIRFELPGTTFDDLHVEWLRRDDDYGFAGPGRNSYFERIEEAASEQEYLESLPLTVGARDEARFLLSFPTSPARGTEAELSLLLRTEDGPLRFSLGFVARRR